MRCTDTVHSDRWSGWGVTDDVLRQAVASDSVPSTFAALTAPTPTVIPVHLF